MTSQLDPLRPHALIAVEPRTLSAAQALLRREHRDPGLEENPWTFTARFGHGIEADIKVVNADPPYVDPVLFDQGREVAVMEPCDTLEGEYHFDHDGKHYTVRVHPSANA